MPRKHRIVTTFDAETDPFVHGRIPKPFLWGFYDGKEFRHWRRTKDFVQFIAEKDVYGYAHNGGRFDFMFLLPYIGETKCLIIAGRIVQMHIGKAILRDSWSSMPGALEKISGKTDIEYWKFEKECRDQYMEEITAYLKDDCINLFRLMKRYERETVLRPTIASNALASARKLGIDPGRTTHRYDARYRRFYFGGRTECFKVGNLQNISVYDINSQYPTAMSQDLPTGDEVSNGTSIRGYSDNQLRRGFFRITATSFGALPVQERQGLCFPWERREYLCTGWEFLQAKRLGLLKDEIIHEFRYHEKTITFKPFIDHWFEQKQIATRTGDKIYREIAKRMLNSLYGKLAQNPVEYKDYKIAPRNTEVDWENGWQLGPSNYGIEIHERPVLWRYRKKWGSEWNRFPIHYNVATAASITGYARAMLLEGIAAVGVEHVAYCDTDSLFVCDGAKTNALPQTGQLGTWNWEGFAPVCHIAGKKLYAMEFTNGPNAGEVKMASKGAKLTMDQIALIAAGEKITYEREAPTFSLANGAYFVVRSIRATGRVAKDERQV